MELREARDVALGRDPERVVARQRRRGARGVARLGEPGDEVQPEAARHPAQPLLARAARRLRDPPAVHREARREHLRQEREDAPSSAARFRSFAAPAWFDFQSSQARSIWRRATRIGGLSPRSLCYARRRWAARSSPRSGTSTRSAKLPTGQTQLFVGPPPRPRGHQPAGVRDAQRAGPGGSRSRRARSRRSTTSSRPHDLARPFADAQAEEMLVSLQRNCREFGIPLLRPRRAGSRGSSTSSGPSSASRSPG